ncbi:MAG TPA: hypothetical protein VFH68_18905 [Polyangia bacterium]|nr:hypothetical protein [Polyangia bacterium]
MRYRNTDAIVLLGLNPTAPDEARALRSFGSEVMLITDGKRSDWISVDGQAFDLADGDQVAAFLRHLRVPEARQEYAAQAFQSVDRDMGDELGHLAMVWAHAERSGIIPGRMVISGEHVGSGMFWSRKASGILRVSDLAKLARAFPKVANAVEDLHMSACQSANEVFSWPKIFPQLKTIWAYAGSCPGTFAGASKHLAIWDKATRGPARKIGRMLAQGTRKGNSVVVWTPLGGLVTGEVSDLPELRARIAAGNATFDEYFEGEANVADPQSGPLRDYYNWLQEALRHPDLTYGERLTFERRRDTTIRLIFYDAQIKVRFADAYRSQISAGYASLALAAPDLAHLSRKEAVLAVGAFESKADRKRADAAEALRPLLVEGLLQLAPRYIPENWI